MGVLSRWREKRRIRRWCAPGCAGVGGRRCPPRPRVAGPGPVLCEKLTSVIHNLSSCILSATPCQGGTPYERRCLRRYGGETPFVTTAPATAGEVRVHRQPCLRHAELGTGQGRPVRGQPVETSRDERHQ